ncbi:UNVERIFIED_ORG: hypothetical protein QE446_004973 [Rhizobium sp. SORGH_AS260]|nr:hypothetical protein [Rhizobium sp. SORGH_AS_0285]MDP9757049.1 hypothetical protein [Rhizobium sp. SORGH_AS_0260]MDR6083702.1 hypothetical protein [Agrobacterium sp. SORGH_AS_0440]
MGGTSSEAAMRAGRVTLDLCFGGRREVFVSSDLYHAP